MFPNPRCWFSIPNQDILSSLDEEKEKERNLMSFGHENSSWISWILISDTRDTKRCCCLLYQFNSTLKPRMCRNPTWVTFSNTFSKLKAQSWNVFFHWNVVKETFEFWTLIFRKCHPKWDWLYLDHEGNRTGDIIIRPIRHGSERPR